MTRTIEEIIKRQQQLTSKGPAYDYLHKMNKMANDNIYFENTIRFTDNKIDEVLDIILQGKPQNLLSLTTVRDFCLWAMVYNWLGWFYYEIKMHTTAQVCFSNYEKVLNLAERKLPQDGLQQFYRTID